MGQSLSIDLRERVIAAIDEGMSCQAAAVAFRGSAATAIRWHKRHHETGKFAPQASGGDIRSRRVLARRDDMLMIWETRKDIALGELRDALAANGHKLRLILNEIALWLPGSRRDSRTTLQN